MMVVFVIGDDELTPYILKTLTGTILSSAKTIREVDTICKSLGYKIVQED
jgi:hypothetical protein